MDLNKYLAKPDKSLREHTDELLKQLEILNSLGYIKDKKVYNLSKDACEYHDYGKANYHMQKRLEASRSGKKIRFDSEVEVGHNILSTLFINEENYSLDDFFTVYNAVLNHHNYTDNLRVLEEEEELIYENLKEFEEEIFEPYEDLAEFKDWIEEETKELVLVKGLLHRCDYSASANDVLKVEYKNDFLEDSMDKLLENWIEKWSEKNDREDSSKPKWNELQDYCKKNSGKNLIVVAQTGMGKTEAGLHWIGDNKGFFVLPLKTAINAIYERVLEEVIENNNIDKRVGLLHSDNLIHYIEDNQKKTRQSDVMEYYNQTKNYAQPLSITTPDQIFDFVFKYPSYEMKATILSYSKIVIDEIQMYSPDLLSYLILGLSKIHKLGGKFCILTATLAPFIKDFIEEKVGKVFEEETFVDDSKRHHLKVEDRELDSEAVEEIKERYMSLGGKVLIVCNTITKAQEVYDKLKDLNSSTNNNEEKEINLFHSKYTKEDRKKKEDAIISFGKTKDKDGNIDKRNGIWISTQVVEASLDIDFDYLYTELSDINGLFQRLGRCNRKGLKSIDNINCYVYTKINSRLLKKKTDDKGFIYEEIYNLSKSVLLEGFKEPRVITEEEKVDIINTTFTTKNIKGGEFYREFNRSYSYINDLYVGEIDKNRVKKEFRNILSKSIIPKGVYDNKKEEIEILQNKIKESDDYLEKIKCMEEIKKFTVSMYLYELDKYNNRQVDLGKFGKIEIADILYDKECGAKRKPKEEVKGKEEEELFF